MVIQFSNVNCLWIMVFKLWILSKTHMNIRLIEFEWEAARIEGKWRSVRGSACLPAKVTVPALNDSKHESQAGGRVFWVTSGAWLPTRHFRVSCFMVSKGNSQGGKGADLLFMVDIGWYQRISVLLGFGERSESGYGVLRPVRGCWGVIWEWTPKGLFDSFWPIGSPDPGVFLFRR